MMLVTYEDSGLKVGLAAEGRLVELRTLAPDVASRGSAAGPLTMNDVIDDWPAWLGPVRDAVERIARNPSAVGRPLAEYRLAAPIPRPRRNPFLIAGNYRAHVAAGERVTGIALSQRKQAIFFNKPTGTVIGPTDDIEHDPTITQKLDYEVEMVVVIGRRGRNITEAEAMSFVWGYTVGNDLSARDIQVVKPTIDFLRGKGLDTLFPIGPGIVPREFLPEYHDLGIRLFLNGVLKQEATLGEMTRDVPQIIAELSRGLTLEAGDLIATGTPAGVLFEEENAVFLHEGDVVICEIDGIGRLVNRVRSLS